MTKIKRAIILTIVAASVAMFVCGCNTTGQVGKFPTLIDGTESEWVPMKTESVNLFGPSQKTTYKFNRRTGETAPLDGATASSPGVLEGAVHTVLNGASSVISAREIRHGLSDSGDRTSVTQEGGGATASADASASAKNKTKVDVDVKNPPSNWPPGLNKGPKDWRK